MWISRVELHNIKSYGPRTVIELAEGINAICGDNGAGKSTILEAIGLALFGQSVYRSQDQLIHAAAKSGEITVSLIDSRDGREYQVVRPLRRGGSPYVFDPEIQRQVANGVSEVQQWLRDCLGVEPTTDLKALFEHAVGVPQGMLTSSFVLTEAQRRQVFDPLLGVDDYKQVWDNMLAVVNSVKEQLHENDKEQQRRVGKLEDLPQLKTDSQDLETVIKDTEADHQQAVDALTELSKKLPVFEQQREAIGSLEGQLTTIEVRRADREAQLAAAEAALAEAGQARETVAECATAYQTHEQAQQERTRLEGERQKRDEIQSRLGACRQAVALVEQSLVALERQLTNVAEAEAALETLKPLVARQAALEQEQRAAEKAVAELRAAEARVADEQKRLDDLQNELAAVQKQVSRREEMAQNIQARQSRSEELTAEVVTLDQTLAGLEGQLEETRQALQAAQARQRTYDALQDKIETAAQTLEQQQGQLATLEAELTRRSELEQDLAALTEARQSRKTQLAELETEISELETAQRQAQESLSQWQTKAQTLRNLQDNLDAAQNRLAEAQAALARLEGELKERAELAEQIRTWETEQGTANAQRDALNNDRSRGQTQRSTIAEAMTAIAVEAETPCPVCQKPLRAHDLTGLKAHYEAEQKQVQAALDEAQANLAQTEQTLKTLEQHINQARQTQEQLATEPQRLKQQADISDYEADVAKLQAQIAAVREAPRQVEAVAAQLEAGQNRLAELKEERTAAQQANEGDEQAQNKLQEEINHLARPADRQRLQADIEKLQSDLPVWREELAAVSDAPAQVGSLTAGNLALSQQKETHHSQRRQLQTERDSLAQEINTLQAEMSDLAGPGRLAELEAELAQQRQTVATWRDKVTDLSEAPAQLETAAKALAELDDPRQKQQAAQGEANKRPQLETDRSTQQAELEAKQAEARAIEAEMEPFADLDQALAQTNATLAQTQAAHQTYLAQRATAETWPQRQTEVETARQKLAEVVKAQDDLQAQLTQAKAAYDPEQHQSAQQAEQEGRTQQTRLQTQLGEYGKQLEQLQEKIAGLEAIAAELDHLKLAGEQLQELQTIIEFIRRTIREAGPEVTKRLVNEVSWRANGFFAEIMNDHQQELRWDETYAISVQQAGYSREFQQLSGGEEMVAALAVRLGLLQSMSKVDVAFFDEPTAHLDPARRASLADQIGRVQGFSQLVIISHDDTFEQDIGHVIHIAKDEQGYSQVVA